MKRTCFGLSLLALAAFAVAGPTQVEKEWSALLSAYSKLELAKDAKGMAKIVNEHFSPELKYIPLKGAAMDHKAFLQSEMDLVKSVVKFSSVAIKVSHFAVKGNSATSDCQFHFAGLMMMPKGQKPGKLVGDGTLKMTYTLKGGKWWVAEMKEVTNKVLLNGKPMA